MGAGLAAGWVARRLSVRIVVAGGLAVVGLSLVGCTTLHGDTGTAALCVILFVVGVGAGFSFTVTADVILSSVPKEEAGAASAVSETAYELGAALGIALLGSIVTGIYRGFAMPPGVSEPTADAARESLGGAFETAGATPRRPGRRAGEGRSGLLRPGRGRRGRGGRGGPAVRRGGRVVPAPRPGAGEQPGPAGHRGALRDRPRSRATGPDRRAAAARRNARKPYGRSAGRRAHTRASGRVLWIKAPATAMIHRTRPGGDCPRTFTPGTRSW